MTSRSRREINSSIVFAGVDGPVPHYGALDAICPETQFRLSHQSATGQEKLALVVELVSESQIEAISGVLANQLAPSGSEGAASAAIIWALMTVRGAISRSVLSKVRRTMRSIDSGFRPDVEGMVEFLVAGRNVRAEGTMFAFHHPRAEDGLRQAFEVHVAEAEYALSLVVEGLVAMDGSDEDWGVETATGVLRAVADLKEASMEINIRSAAQDRIDSFLVRCVERADHGHAYGRALRDLAQFGKPSHVPCRLAQLLVVGPHGPGRTTLMDVWHAPSLSTEETIKVAGHPLTARLVGRFVREVLPETAMHYEDGLAAFLTELAPEVGQAFGEALQEVAGHDRPCGNIGAIVVGACSGQLEDYERVIEMFGRAYEELHAWLQGPFAEELRKAEEHEVDADEADMIVEEPGERLFNAETGLEAVVRLRGASEGLGWISGHRYRECLVRAAGRVICHKELVPRPGELRGLLDEADDWGRQAVWRAAEQYWDEELADVLRRELVRGGARSPYRKCLVSVARSRNGERVDWVEELAEVVRLASQERQLELAHDLIESGREPGSGGVEAAKAVADLLSDGMAKPVGEVARLITGVLANTESLGVADHLSEEARGWLSNNLDRVGDDVASVLAPIGARLGIDVISTSRRLLRNGDAEYGLRAVAGLDLDGGEIAKKVLGDAMDHGKYHVRSAALKTLARRASARERTQIVARARDRSADVRLAFATAMEKYRWPEATEALAELLRDKRDFSIGHSSTNWSRLGVARAAAQALGAYQDLPKPAVNALLEAGRENSRDPFVGCWAIAAIASRDAEGVEELIVESLDSSGLAETPQIRPKVQAAAWAVFDRVLAERPIPIDKAMMDMAIEDRAIVAGPLLMAIGVLGGEVRSTMLDRLGRTGPAERAELLRVAAVANAKTTGVDLQDTETLLTLLADGDDGDRLNQDERSLLERWSLGLDPRRDVQKFTAWIANSVFGLRVSEEVGNPRKLETSGSIPVVTMRSLSSLRESEIPGP